MEWIMNNYTLAEIKDELFNRGLPVTGLKHDSATRLFNSQFTSSSKLNRNINLLKSWFTSIKSIKITKRQSISASEADCSTPQIDQKTPSNIEVKPKLRWKSSEIGLHLLKGVVLSLAAVGIRALATYFMTGDEVIEVKLPPRSWLW